MKFAACFLLLTFSVAAFGQAKPASETTKLPTQTKKYSCVAGPDEQCASDLWFTEYKRLESIVAKYQTPKMPQDVEDQVNGMRLRLSRDIPAGYRWDGAKERYLKIANAPQPATPGATPTPAPVQPNPTQPATPGATPTPAPVQPNPTKGAAMVPKSAETAAK